MLDTRSKINEALGVLGAEMGFDLALDSNGSIVLEFSEDIALTLEYPLESERICLHANVCFLPRGAREQALVLALKRNLFEQGLSGSWLALDKETEEVVLCATIPAKVFEPELFAEVLAAFIAEVKAVRGSISATGVTSPETPSRVEPVSFDEYIIRG